jgi:hypothetical protein
MKKRYFSIRVPSAASPAAPAVPMVRETRRASPRSPLARRRPPPPMEFTDRDAAILRAVHAHRFATTDQIVRIMGGWGGKTWNKRKIQDRLHKLFHNGYLDLPQCQVQDWKLGRPHEYVHGLGNRGADELNVREGVRRTKVDWKDKNYTFKLYPLKHTLLVTEVAVSLEVAARQAKAVRPIWLDEIVADAPASRQGKQHDRWDVEIERSQAEPKSVRVVPDKIFGIQRLDRPQGQNRYHFFLEADLRTESIHRTSPNQVSFAEKLSAYRASFLAWKREVDQQLTPLRPFAFHGFRVLTVTTGPKRIASMVAHVQKLSTQGRGLFLFTDVETLYAYRDNILRLPWTSGGGEMVRLVD